MAMPQQRTLFSVLVFLLMTGVTGVPTVVSQIYTQTTAFVSASSETVSPGETFTLNAGGGPLDGGMIVSYSSGVTLVGEPTCYVPCGDYWVDESTGRFGVDSLGSEINVELQLRVDEAIGIGNWINFSVTIVGGNPNITMSSTSVQVVAPAASLQSAPTSDLQPQVQASASTSPSIFFAEPGGSFYVDVLPNIYGLLQDQDVEPVLWVTLPSGISLIDDPLCGDEPFVSQLSECDNYQERQNTRTPLIFNPADRRIVLHLQVDHSIKAETDLTVEVRITTSINAPTVENPLRVSIVETGTLPQMEMTDKIVGLELHGNYRNLSSGVCESDSPLDLSLYSWGDMGATLFSTDPEYSSGVITSSSLDPAQEVCRIYVRFSAVPSGIDRMLLAYTGDPGFLCRACVLGALLPTDNALIIIPIGYAPTG